MGLDNAGYAMLASQVVGAGATMAGAYSQSQALKVQGDYARQQSEENARLAEMEAEEELRRGAEEERRHKTAVQRLISAQRAVLAAQGQDLEEGTPLEIQEETASLGAEDASRIRNDAYLRAWSRRYEAATSRSRGRMAQRAARNQAGATLLTGGLNVARQVSAGTYDYQRYKQGK